MGILLQSGVNLRFEEAELLAGLVVWNQVVTDPAVNGGFRGFVGKVCAQLLKIEPLVFFLFVLLVVPVENQGFEFIDFLDEGGYRLGQLVE